MILFQEQIEEHQKLAEHYRELAAQREALAAGLVTVQQQADTDLSSLKLLVDKCKEVSPNAIASLKSAVLNLFSDGDNGGDGGQPTKPTPGPDDDEGQAAIGTEQLVEEGLTESSACEMEESELLCLNGLTGECLTTVNDEELPTDNPVGDEWVLSSSTALTGQTCDINPALYWEITPPDGSCWEFASPYACLLWEDAPMLEQYCTITPGTTEVNQNKSTLEVEGMAYIELVRHPENEAVAYQRKHDGQIVCTYLGFRTKVIASSWLRAVEVLTSAVELRQAKRITGFKWELKIKGLSMTQIDRLARENLTRTYRQEITEAVKPPTYKEPERKLPVNPDEVKPGDIVTPLLTPGDSYEIIQVMPNGILDCRSLRTGVNMGMRPGAVSLLSKGEKPQPVEPIEFNDVVEVVADGNDTVGLVGTFGRVKTVKNDRIGVEVDEQLVYFNKAELKLKVKAQAPTPQQSCPPPADVSLSDQDATYLQTNGNYKGLAKQTRQRWEQAGINPSDLIADMRANRPTEPAWDAAKYNPVLAAISSEYDF